MHNTKIVSLPDEIRGAVRNASRDLLGNKYRLEVGVEIARSPNGRVYGAGIASQTGASDQQVGDELRRFSRADVIAAIDPEDPGQKRHYYRRIESSYWDGLVALAEELIAREERRAASRLRQLRPA